MLAAVIGKIMQLIGKDKAKVARNDHRVIKSVFQISTENLEHEIAYAFDMTGGYRIDALEYLGIEPDGVCAWAVWQNGKSTDRVVWDDTPLVIVLHEVAKEMSASPAYKSLVSLKYSLGA